MLLQPIVENAIVHGLIPIKDHPTISLNIRLEDVYMIYSVIDNGIGRKAAEKSKKTYKKNHQSFATQIMKERIDIFNYYNKAQFSFHIIDLYDEHGVAKGTQVNLKIPTDFKTREQVNPQLEIQ